MIGAPDPASPAPAPSDSPFEPRPGLFGSARARRTLLTVAGVLYATGTTGSVLAPAWIDERPELVLALSSRNRNLFASVPYIDPLPYALIGFARLFVVGIVLFHVGKVFGAAALGWTERQLGELPTIYRWAAKGIDRAGWLLVVWMPGSNLVCLMAGHRRMRDRTFAILLAIGIVLKLVVLWVGGQIFESQIRTALDFIDDYQWYVVGGLLVLSMIQPRGRSRKLPRPGGPPGPGSHTA